MQTLRRWAADLGVEPGTAASEAARPTKQPELTLLELARVVQLKGLCTAARAAAVLAADEPSVESVLAANECFRQTREGGEEDDLQARGERWLLIGIGVESAASDLAGCW